MVGDHIAGRRSLGGYSLRWDADCASAAYRDGWWVRSTLADALRQAAVETPDRVLVIDGAQRISCRQLHDQAMTLAQALLARLPVGSVVSFMLPNWHEAVVIYHAITLAGMVAHPILPSLRDRELQFQLRDVRSRLLFIPSAFRNLDAVAMLDRVCALLESPPEVVVLRGGDADRPTRWVDLLASAAAAKHDLPPIDADAVRLVMYTSGTSGNAKGVLHTHNSLHALLRQIGQHWHVAAGDCFLVPSPISHIGGSIYAFEAPLLLGSSAVLMERWDADLALDLAVAESCTHICGATPFLEQLLDVAQCRDQPLPSLKLFVCGGASVPPSLIHAAAKQFPTAAITRVYGSTEVPVTTIGCPDRNDLAHAAATDGRPGAATVKLGDAPQSADDEGEVLVRGPQMLAGYLHVGDEAAVFDDDGYYRSGDLAHWVDDGYLVISGRSKDLIIRHGENISPKEIEDVLMEHPQIAEIAVVGIPDSRTGERACAVIVAVADATPDVAALCSFLASKGMAAFKFPEQVALWDALPRNDTGKVLKHQIRATLAARRTSPSAEAAR